MYVLIYLHTELHSILLLKGVKTFTNECFETSYFTVLAYNQYVYIIIPYSSRIEIHAKYPSR